MPRIIVLATDDLNDDTAAVTLDEAISVGLLQDNHSQRQLVERLTWGAQDAQRIQALKPTRYTDIPAG